MNNLQRITKALRRLNELQAKPLAAWTSGLTSAERELAIEHARVGLPTSVLGHHDRLVVRGKRSLAWVHNGVCGSCHIRLPIGHRNPSARGGDLDVCENCGVFLEWPVEDSQSGNLPQSSTSAVKKSKGKVRLRERALRPGK